MSGISRAVFGDVRDAAAAAIHNEGLTRQRVEKLEEAVKREAETRALSVVAQAEWIEALQETVKANRSILHRGFWGRLKWLLLGR